MKTIKVRVGWTARMSTYLDVEVDEEEFTGTLTEEQEQDAIASKDYASEDWRDEEDYDYTVEIVEE
jgi:hypothetical protein